jgi:hypothetical protein
MSTKFEWFADFLDSQNITLLCDLITRQDHTQIMVRQMIDIASFLLNVSLNWDVAVTSSKTKCTLLGLLHTITGQATTTTKMTRTRRVGDNGVHNNDSLKVLYYYKTMPSQLDLVSTPQTVWGGGGRRCMRKSFTRGCRLRLGSAAWFRRLELVGTSVPYGTG